MKTEFQELFEDNSLDINEVESLERTRVQWDGEDTITVELLERGEVTLRRTIGPNGENELTVISEQTARDITRDMLRNYRERMIAESIGALDSDTNCD